MAAVVDPQLSAEPNGAGAETAGRIAVENPATGEAIGYVDELDAGRVSQLVERARAAQPGWHELGFAGRGLLLRRLRHWIVSNRDRVVDTVVAETGKTREDALLGELWYTCDALGFSTTELPAINAGIASPKQLLTG